MWINGEKRGLSFKTVREDREQRALDAGGMSPPGTMRFPVTCQRVTMPFKSVKAVTANEGRSKRLGSPRQGPKTDAEAEFRALGPGGCVGACEFSQGRAWGFCPWFGTHSEGGG